MRDRIEAPWDLNDEALVAAMDELPLWSAPFGLALLDTVRYGRGLRVLDLGGGLGFPALELAQRLGRGSHVTTLDPWAAGMARLREKARQYRVRTVSPVRGVAERMPIADASVDLITSNNGLNNVADLREAWRECARVARPGAQAVITENLPGTMVEFYEVLRETLEDLGLARCVPAIAAHIHQKRKPIEETRDIITQSGFRILGESHGSFTLRYADGEAFLNHFLVRVGFLPAWRSLVPEGDTDRVFAAVEERLNRRAADKGHVALGVPFVCLDCQRL